MAKIIGVYNNKGGVGKTTLTLFLSDFLASISINKRKAKVLVIDFDPQSSCANALLGVDKVAEIQAKEQTISSELTRAIQKDGKVDLANCIHTREITAKVNTRKTRIGKLDVMLVDADTMLHFDEYATLERARQCATLLKKRLSKQYDFIFVDFPGNLSKVNKCSLIGAFLVEHFIIPIEPNRINLNAISGTVKMLENLSEWRGEEAHDVLGIVLNKADKRTKQYKDHKARLVEIANQFGCKIYDNILPPTPKLANATDDSITFFTLAEKYDSYYENVRKLVIEIVQAFGLSQRNSKASSK